MVNFIEISMTTISFQFESVKSSGSSPVYDCTAEINRYVFKYTYIPYTVMRGNTKFSIYHPTEGSLHSPITSVGTAVCKLLWRQSTWYSRHILSTELDILQACVQLEALSPSQCLSEIHSLQLSFTAFS